MFNLNQENNLLNHILQFFYDLLRAFDTVDRNLLLYIEENASLRR